MSYKSNARRKNLSLVASLFLTGILLTLVAASFSAGWSVAYGSTGPVPPSSTPTTTQENPPGSTSPVSTTQPTTTTPPGSSTPPSSTTPEATTPASNNPVCPASSLVKPPAGSGNFADAAFGLVWERTDLPVANGSTVRTWLWGPAPGIALKEEYGSSGGSCLQRLVQYFDKSRMEITNPQGNRTSQWFVTNGLLARELISGDMQLGDNTFLKRQPALVQVAGDQDDPNSPTYADLKSLSTLAPGQNLAGDATGSFVNAGLVKGEGVTATGSLGQTYGVRYTNFDAQSGHNIAGPFWDFLNSSGPVLENGSLVTGKLFDPTFFATGLPLSEAYWVRARVGGVEKDVLVQVFERRVLTYTPSNEAQWRVEMGNIGQHYFRWRYGDQAAFPVTQGQ